MTNSLSKLKDLFFHLCVKQTVICLIVLFCIGVGIALSNMSSLSKSLIETQSLQSSRYQANSIIKTWDLYSRSVAVRLGKIKEVKITHDYFLREGSIPPPATFILELGTQISGDEEGSSIGLYSDYPYPWRKDRPHNKFADEALAYFKENTANKEFYRLEDSIHGSRWKYAKAIIMETSCVACHNTHPDSPKKNWNVGDVRGVIAISEPLNKISEQTKKALRTASLMLSGFSVLGVSGLVLVINKLNQETKDLEIIVRERTADLADINEDLEKKNHLIRQVFGRYLSDEIVANLLESPQSLTLGGERRKITILTSDLRGFTAASERLSAEEVISILNIYLDSMADIITQYHGTINEFMGDGILVLFGAPTEREDDSLRAIVCAVKMQLAMGKVNQKLKNLGFPQLEMGIGINTGLVVVGNVGSEKRAKYGIVGSEVNITYRIESYTTGGQILISESAFRESREVISIRGQKQVQPKGVKDLINIYDVDGVRGNYNIFLPREEEIFVNLTEAIPIKYAILEGKHLGNNILPGCIIQLSKKGAKIQVQNPTENSIPMEFTNIKLNLMSNDNSSVIEEDIYAKVGDSFLGNGTFYVHFTSQTSSLQKIIERLFVS